MTFDFLSQAPGGTAEYAFDMLGADASPTFIVKPASEANAAYQNLRLRTQNDPRIKVSRRRATAAQLDGIREYWAEIYAKTVVQSWLDVFENGAPAPCTPEKVLEFLLALLARRPDGSQPLVEMLDDFIAYCRNMSNFRDGGPTAEVAALGKG